MKKFENILISVIVPVYNAENSLKLCLKSLLEQSFKNIEIILINDGSTDNSLKICRKFQNKDRRILVIDQHNQGRAAVRNLGINMASGDYIMFVDSDDYVSKNFCMDALKVVYTQNVDIVLFDYYLENNQGKYLKRTCNRDGILTKEEAMLAVTNASFLPMKIFNKSLFNNIKFPVGKDYEDVFVTYQLVDKAKKLYHLSVPLYYYVQHNNSVTHIKNSQTTSDYFEASYTRLKFLKNKFPNVATYAKRELKLISFFYLIYNKNGEFVSEAQNVFNSKVKFPALSRKLRQIIWLYRFMPDLVRIIVKQYFN